MPTELFTTTSANTTAAANGVRTATFTPLADVETYQIEAIGGGGGGGGDGDFGGHGSIVRTLFTGVRDALSIRLGGGGSGGGGAGGGAGGANGGGAALVNQLGGGGGGKTTVL